MPEPYVGRPAPAHMMKRRNFLEAIDRMALVAGSAREAMDAAAAATLKPKDRIYWREEDAFVEGNPKLARLALAAGLNVKAMFDLGDPSALT